MNVAWGARTEVGHVRKGNEDSYLVQEPLFVVADGMGGHVAGDIASSTAVDVITKEAGDTDPSDPETLAKVLRDANAAIIGRAEEDASLQGMGTTCTLLLLDDSRGHFAHVGDSRAYLFRDGSLKQVTEDHTLVGRMVREGRLSQEEAQHHPQRNIITRALGNDDDVQIDVFTVNLESGDRVLLCSDGLTSMVTNDAIAEVLSGESDPQIAADRLVDLALDAGGEDNVTVVLLDLGSGAAGRARDPESHRATGSMPAAAAGNAPPPPDATGAVDTAAVASASPAPVQEVARASERRPSPEPEPEPEPAPPPRRVGRRLTVALVVIAVVGGLLFAGARYALTNSWFVGVNDSGLVTIYQGRPEEFAGMNLAEVHDETTLAIDDLPEYIHDDLAEGIKVDSLEEARQTVSTLQSRARRN